MTENVMLRANPTVRNILNIPATPDLGVLTILTILVLIDHRHNHSLATPSRGIRVRREMDLDRLIQMIRRSTKKRKRIWTVSTISLPRLCSANAVLNRKSQETDQALSQQSMRVACPRL
jgi:hypothetical protein